MNWDLIGSIATGMWDGLISQLWLYFCIIGTIATVIGVWDTLTKDRG